MFHIRYADDILWILNYIQKLYNANAETKSQTRAEYFNHFGLFTEILFGLLTCGIILICIMLCSAPIYAYFMDGELVPFLPIFMPCMDETTPIGYAMLMIFQLFVFLVGNSFFLSFEFLLDVMVISSLIFGKLIALDTEQINNDLKRKMFNDAKFRLRNIFLMHREMSECVFLTSANEFFRL